jgi:hypothetical protein
MCRIRRSSGLVKGVTPHVLCLRVLYPGPALRPPWCYTNIYFVENQLSPSSISFSLLATAHPMLLQQQRVRPIRRRGPPRRRGLCGWAVPPAPGFVGPGGGPPQFAVGGSTGGPLARWGVGDRSPPPDPPRTAGRGRRTDGAPPPPRCPLPPGGAPLPTCAAVRLAMARSLGFGSNAGNSPIGPAGPGLLAFGAPTF